MTAASEKYTGFLVEPHSWTGSKLIVFGDRAVDGV